MNYGSLWEHALVAHMLVEQLMRNLSKEIAARGTARVQLAAICLCGVIVATLLGVWIYLLVHRDPQSRDLLPIITTVMGLMVGTAKSKTFR